MIVGKDPKLSAEQVVARAVMEDLMMGKAACLAILRKFENLTNPTA